MNTNEPILLNGDAYDALCAFYDGVPSPPVSESALESLFRYGFLSTKLIDVDLDGDVPVELRSAPFITERGRAYVEARRCHDDEWNQRFHSLEAISESLRERVSIAEKDSRASSIRSWIAIVISLASIVSSILVAVFL